MSTMTRTAALRLATFMIAAVVAFTSVTAQAGDRGHDRYDRRDRHERYDRHDRHDDRRHDDRHRSKKSKSDSSDAAAVALFALGALLVVGMISESNRAKQKAAPAPRYTPEPYHPEPQYRAPAPQDDGGDYYTPRDGRGDYAPAPQVRPAPSTDAPRGVQSAPSSDYVVAEIGDGQRIVQRRVRGADAILQSWSRSEGRWIDIRLYPSIW